MLVVNLAVPVTSNVTVGEVVLIPTFPFESIIILELLNEAL